MQFSKIVRGEDLTCYHTTVRPGETAYIQPQLLFTLNTDDLPKDGSIAEVGLKAALTLGQDFGRSSVSNIIYGSAVTAKFPDGSSTIHQPGEGSWDYVPAFAFQAYNHTDKDTTLVCVAPKLSVAHQSHNLYVKSGDAAIIAKSKEQPKRYKYVYVASGKMEINTAKVEAGNIIKIKKWDQDYPIRSVGDVPLALIITEV